MNTSELHYVKGGPSGEKVLVVGATPRISVDARIKCPRHFHGRESPPPPSLRHIEIAQSAAQKILAAVWPCRRFLEAVKVGYTLDPVYPYRLYVTGEIVIVIPAIVEKSIVYEEETIAGDRWNQDYRGFDLDGHDLMYDQVLDSLVRRLTEKTKEMVAGQDIKIDGIREVLSLYQDVFSRLD